MRKVMDKLDQANKEAEDKNGFTPLHFAAAGGHELCVTALLGLQAAPDAVAVVPAGALLFFWSLVSPLRLGMSPPTLLR